MSLLPHEPVITVETNASKHPSRNQGRLFQNHRLANCLHIVFNAKFWSLVVNPQRSVHITSLTMKSHPYCPTARELNLPEWNKKLSKSFLSTEAYSIPDNSSPRYQENWLAFLERNTGNCRTSVWGGGVNEAGYLLARTTEWLLSGVVPGLGKPYYFWSLYVGLVLFLFDQTPYFLRYFPWFQIHPCSADIVVDGPQYEV